jgi:hypothetical protein
MDEWTIVVRTISAVREITYCRDSFADGCLNSQTLIEKKAVV